MVSPTALFLSVFGSRRGKRKQPADLTIIVMAAAFLNRGAVLNIPGQAPHCRQRYGNRMGRRSKKTTATRAASVAPRSGVVSFGKRSAELNDRWIVLGVCIFLAAITWLVFGQTLRHQFVNYDDDDYVVKNAQVARGLTLEGIVWAFTHVHAANWHPLTWISHMLDCQLYGLNPGGHHLTNVLLHAATAILLFLVLRQMTDTLWRSAFVAAVFAIHPLRVESVAWVAERKDVLSALFFMLTVAAYVRYARAVVAFSLWTRGPPVCAGPHVQTDASDNALCPSSVGLLAA